jgi:rhodanese-related sulfurtransferase
MKSIFSAFCWGLLVLSCGPKTFDEQMQTLYSHSVPLIHASQVQKQINSTNPIILDIRSQAEYEVSHIKGSQFIDYECFRASDVAHLPKDSEIIVYCAVGYRSEKIGEKLISLGFDHVSNLYGGIFDWKNQDYVVVNHLNLPTDSVHTYNKDWAKWLYKGIKVYK